MSLFMHRRRVLQAGSSAIFASAMNSAAGGALAANTDELRVMVYGGDIAKAYIEAFVKPFEAETGIKVTSITDQITFAQLELMVNSKTTTVDVAPITQGSTIIGSEKGLLEPIDYSKFKKEELDGLFEFVKHLFGVGQLIFSYVMVYNTDKLPADKPRPSTWAEFWDVKQSRASRQWSPAEAEASAPRSSRS